MSNDDKKTLTERMDALLYPTGRLIYDPLVKPARQSGKTNTNIDVSRWNESDADPLADLQHWLKMLNDPRVTRSIAENGEAAIIVKGGDYTVLEAHMLAAMIHESDGSILLQLDPHGGMVPGTVDIHYELEQPKVKQNGKSADYLRHNPTPRSARRRGR